ncbi:aldo/keto reductase [Streptosporangium soli]
MKHVSVGELDVARIGLGAMGMSHGYTDSGTDEAESIRTLHRALELGVTLIDTAEIYGPYANEELLGRALKGRRDQVVLAIHRGIRRGRLPARQPAVHRRELPSQPADR